MQPLAEAAMHGCHQLHHGTRQPLKNHAAGLRRSAAKAAGGSCLNDADVYLPSLGYLYWQKTDKKILKRINHFIQDTQRSPYEGIGKSEQLRHALAGYWSRRINDEHRVVYKCTESNVLIAQLRYHYSQ